MVLLDVGHNLFKSVGDNLIWLGAVAVALFYLGRSTQRIFRGAMVASAVIRLAEYELRNNGGGSMKDRIESADKGVSEIRDLVVNLTGRFEEFVRSDEEEKNAMWAAINHRSAS